MARLLKKARSKNWPPANCTAEASRSIGGAPLPMKPAVGARIPDPATVLVDAGPDATRLRYLWADSPIANLYDSDGLPVTPFEVALP